jgi:hypothetical protein
MDCPLLRQRAVREGHRRTIELLIAGVVAVCSLGNRDLPYAAMPWLLLSLAVAMTNRFTCIAALFVSVPRALLLPRYYPVLSAL